MYVSVKHVRTGNIIFVQYSKEERGKRIYCMKGIHMRVDKLVKLKLRERHSPLFVKKLIQTTFTYCNNQLAVKGERGRRPSAPITFDSSL